MYIHRNILIYDVINYYEEDLLKYMSLEREREREKEYYSDLLFYLLVQEVYTSDYY